MIHTIRWAGLIAATWLITMVGATHAQTRSSRPYDHKINVSYESPNPPTRSHGYIEHRFVVSNGSESAHEVTIQFPSNTYSGRNESRIHLVRRTARVDAGATANVSILVPSFPPMQGQGVTVLIDGDEQDQPLQASFSNYGGPSSRGGPMENLVLVSKTNNLAIDLRQMVDRLGNFGRVTTLSQSELMPTMGTVGEWESDWLSYSSYDGIVITEKDYRGMPAGVRSALLHYTEAGGVLVLVGKVEAAGIVATFEQSISGFGGSRAYDAGFGYGIVIEDETITENWVQSHSAMLGHCIGSTKQPWQSMRTVNQASNEFPIVDDMSIPVKGLFIMMLLFIIVIGPVNFMVLSQMKKRIWMLWTVPAISAVTCLLVFGLMLLMEGWSGHLRTETVTYLDQRSKRASTLGWTGFYSPVVPGDGLHFSRSTELTLQEASRYSGRGYGRGYGGRDAGGNKACHLDWTEEQNLKQGWLIARIPTHFQVRKSESREERINIFREDGKLTATNVLGAPIKSLLVMDEKSQLHRAKNIQAGAKVVLEPIEDAGPPGRGDLRSLFLSDWLVSLKMLPQQQSSYLRPNSYCAELEESPFFEDGLRGAKDKSYHCWVLGLFEMNK